MSHWHSVTECDRDVRNQYSLLIGCTSIPQVTTQKSRLTLLPCSAEDMLEWPVTKSTCIWALSMTPESPLSHHSPSLHQPPPLPITLKSLFYLRVISPIFTNIVLPSNFHWCMRIERMRGGAEQKQKLYSSSECPPWINFICFYGAGRLVTRVTAMIHNKHPSLFPAP